MKFVAFLHVGVYFYFINKGWIKQNMPVSSTDALLHTKNYLHQAHCPFLHHKDFCQLTNFNFQQNIVNIQGYGWDNKRFE